MGKKKKRKKEARRDNNDFRTALSAAVIAGIIVEVFSRLLDWLTSR